MGRPTNLPRYVGERCPYCQGIEVTPSDPVPSRPRRRDVQFPTILIGRVHGVGYRVSGFRRHASTVGESVDVGWTDPTRLREVGLPKRPPRQLFGQRGAKGVSVVVFAPWHLTISDQEQSVGVVGRHASSRW